MSRSKSRSNVASNNNNNNKMVGDGDWQTVNVLEFTKFKKQMPKKYLEPGTSVICTHNKVRSDPESG